MATKRLFLAVGLIALMVPAAGAQKPDVPKDAKPAVVQTELSAREKGILGVYKPKEGQGVTITVKAMGKQLILAAEGFPEVPVTLTDKDTLTSTVLPEGFKFTVQRDKDGNVTGLKVETPMGNADLVYSPGDAKKPEPAYACPDMLGVYEPDMTADGIHKGEVVFEGGKLLLRSEGQPDVEVKLAKDDTLVFTPALPDGITVKMARDKDGKIIGSDLKSAQGSVHYTRKTFPKPPLAPAKPAIPDILGKYEPETPGPVGPGEIILRDGKLVATGDGQPDREFTVDKDDNLVMPDLPAGVTARLAKDKDGKYVKIIIKADANEIVLVRKTFPKPPADKTADKPGADKLKEVAGVYKSEMPGIPVVTFTFREGKLYAEAEGNPEIEVTLGEKDVIKSDKLPEGFTLTLERDKDGKITGIAVKTPMGDVVLKRQPDQPEKKA